MRAPIVVPAQHPRPLVIAVTPTQLPILRVHTIVDCLCGACGVFVGQISIYPRGQIGLAALCTVCQQNALYALSS
ncbi:MAG TPA: hypothetical protein VGM50_22915 [Gemmatimonadaceae bacterium]|jgi:hypothetical protein